MHVVCDGDVENHRHHPVKRFFNILCALLNLYRSRRADKKSIVTHSLIHTQNIRATNDSTRSGAFLASHTASFTNHLHLNLLGFVDSTYFGGRSSSTAPAMDREEREVFQMVVIVFFFFRFSIR